MNAAYDDSEGHHNPTGSVLLPSNTSKAAVNMRKLQQCPEKCPILSCAAFMAPMLTQTECARVKLTHLSAWQMLQCMTDASPHVTRLSP